MSDRKRRLKGDGAIFQRHDSRLCPPPSVDGSRPKHRCQGRWTASVEVPTTNGTRKRLTVYGRTLTEAREKMRSRQEQLAAGASAMDANILLSAYAKQWSNSTLAASPRKATTIATYDALIRAHILLSDLGAMRLRSLRGQVIEAWLLDLQRPNTEGEALSPSSARQVLTILSMILKTAQRDGLLLRNPAEGVSRPRVTSVEVCFLNSGEVARLVAAANERTRYGTLIALLAATGMRRGEALALRWSDVDTRTGQVHIKGTLSRISGTLRITSPKSARSRRTLPGSEVTQRLLTMARKEQAEARLRAGTLWKECDAVFTSEVGSYVDPRNVLRAVKIAAKAADLAPDVNVHTLRHTAATIMLEDGVPLHTVSEILGHSSVAITGDLYGHVSTEGAVAAMNRLSRALRGI